MSATRAFWIFTGLLAVAACDDFKAPANATHNAQAAATSQPALAPSPNAVPVLNPPAPPAQAAATPASSRPQAQAIETAANNAASSRKAAASATQPFLVRVEVLLDRAHFSPGVIDGKPGSNFQRAVSAYRAAHGLPAGAADGALLQSLKGADWAPVTQDYVITADDEKGPFLGTVPSGMEALSKLQRVGFATPLQALAEKFHMSEALLKSLNPNADFSKVGTSLVVIQTGATPIQEIAKVEVDKAGNQVRAMDGAGKILAVFPATVGSTERPAPSGEWAVKSVTNDPTYTYDPSRLTFGDKSHGKLTIAPGPNNPVGEVWIALTAETYGIHGTPDPTLVGKTASHGCVRLTNWDAKALGKALTPGTPVVFVGETSKA
ncbi:MAG TPA: L,D-transpeptidase [Caulobacteraceae bacterium]|jgi:lipoprotein-anchoring transpeptidase ErfK/SrfK